MRARTRVLAPGDQIPNVSCRNGATSTRDTLSSSRNSRIHFSHRKAIRSSVRESFEPEIKVRCSRWPRNNGIRFRRQNIPSGGHLCHSNHCWTNYPTRYALIQDQDPVNSARFTRINTNFLRIGCSSCFTAAFFALTRQLA